MDTRQLAAFCAVVERRSFSQAAEQLGVTQPAVSLQIRALEERLGTRLLDRSGRRVEPTEAGLALYRSAQKMLQLAGREADIVGINPNLRRGAVTDDAIKSTLVEATQQKLQWVREGAGDRFDDLELQIRYFLAAITDDASRRNIPMSRSLCGRLWFPEQRSIAHPPAK